MWNSPESQTFEPWGSSLPLLVDVLEPFKHIAMEIRRGSVSIMLDYVLLEEDEQVILWCAIRARGFGGRVFGIRHGASLRSGLPVWLNDFKNSLERQASNSGNGFANGHAQANGHIHLSSATKAISKRDSFVFK